MLLEQYLQNVGLDDKEAKLYLASLQLGPASIQDLSKMSEIKRSTVYEIIESLIDKNLVNVTQKGKRKLFVAQEPDNLLLYLKQKENILNQIMPDLEALKNTTANKPTVRIFEGLDGLKKIYEDMIKKPGEISAMTAPTEKISKMVINYLHDDWEKRRVAMKVPIKRISTISSDEDSFVGKTEYKNRLEEIISWPEEGYPFSIGIYAYRQKVAFVSYQEQEMVGIILRSPEVNKTVKMMFDLFWNVKK